MTRTEWLLQLQERAYRTSPWHSLLQSLDGISEEAFAYRPARHNGFPWMNGSVQDIVYHITGDKLVQASHAFEKAKLSWENLSVSKTNLVEMLMQLDAAHCIVKAHLQGLTDDSLRDKVTSWGGKVMRADELFLMLIEHDLYHAGQIRYIRNVAE